MLDFNKMKIFPSFVFLLIVGCYIVSTLSRYSSKKARNDRRTKLNPRRFSNGDFLRSLDNEEIKTASSGFKSTHCSQNAPQEFSRGIIGGNIENGDIAGALEDAYNEPIQVMCEINGFMVPGIIDTGAQISVMSASCARRCRIAQNLDTRFAGRAIGVGATDILGQIGDLPIRAGPLSFTSKISILRESGAEFILGRDFLRRFRADICMHRNVLTVHVRDKVLRMPLATRPDHGAFGGHFTTEPASSYELSAEDVSAPLPGSADVVEQVEIATVRPPLDIYGEIEEDVGERVSMEGV